MANRPVDPRTYRISPNFVLGDFLGCHSVYSRGYANPFVFDDAAEAKLENLKALCYEALEPILGEFGPLSIAYSYISPELSRAIVKYQDPEKPSHHRYDLGAAADICVHNWVNGKEHKLMDLYFPDSVVGAPIALAHGIDYLNIPYSRLITYSESPYLCVAVSASEVVADNPRKAFYENRFEGVPKQKPAYLQYSTPQARDRALSALQEKGLEHDWRGGGYPSYHGGGFRQFQHIRVSKYTMLSDWLFDLKSISNGAKNVPSMNLESVQDSFAAAGIVHDWILAKLDLHRMSIVAGYVSHTNPYFDARNDWRSGRISFSVNLPDDANPEWAAENLGGPNGVFFTSDGDFLTANIDVEMVMDEPEEAWHVA